MANTYLPLILVLISLGVGVSIFLLKEEAYKTRTLLNLGGALLKLLLVGVMLQGVLIGESFRFEAPLVQGVSFVLNADALSLLFGSLSALLWLLTTVYAIGYLENAPNRSRFFGFFSLCVMSSVGIAMAGNLFTFFIFYELLTLTTYPLVIHRQTEDSIKAGKVYLLYTVGGGILLLVATVWLHAITGAMDFTYGGYLEAFEQSHTLELYLLFFLFIAAFGVKAALVGLHGWLPRAMVAPAPVSALLHAVAVVKAGAFGVVRLVYDVYGITLSYALHLLTPLMVLACATILFGSMMALFQDDLKKRLAYSTVSQVSYILLGVSLFGPLGTIGGLVHLVHQGIMKITLFFCAGNFAETYNLKKVSQLGGLGRQMPLSALAFSVAALGMIGLPPLAGFVSKWYLGLGALEAGFGWVIGVLVASSLLNAAYFLPVIYALWFGKPTEPFTPHISFNPRAETRLLLLIPPLITAVLVVGLGLFAAHDLSALSWVKRITTLEYP
ncbi:MAG: monovalent cation/H+ antiporter subunit D family protein [Campylobacterales bacterium]|nr:monovalent cation/H+ antiporter subunit D family protein [Campylobacterales bacterium]